MASIFDALTAADELAATGDSSSRYREEDVPVPSPAQAGAESGLAITPRQVKDTCQELLKLGLLEAAKKPNLYRIATTHAADIDRILEPLDLALKIDDVRGLAFLVVAQPLFLEAEDEWSHPLVRRQRLTLEQSLLVALLRQHYVAHEQEGGIGAGDAQVALEDLLPQLQLYLGNLGSDAREQQRLRTLLEKLKPHGIVSEVDPHDQVAIRPIIVHLANPENLQSLLQAFKHAAQPAGAGDGGVSNDPEDAA